MNLNPIFSEKKNTNNMIKKNRKTRSDKIHDMKFPVTVEQKKVFRTKAKLEGYRTVTEYSTALLLKALKSQSNSFPLINYKDTKTYIHVKPTERDYEIISNLTIEWNMRSERQTLHRIMIGMLESGGRL